MNNILLNEEILLKEISKVLVGANDWYGRPGKVKKNQTGMITAEEMTYMGSVDNDFNISFPSDQE